MRHAVREYVYGNHPSQFVRLFLPSGGPLPVAVVIHGGFWRQLYDLAQSEAVAEDLTRFGVAAALIEYRRVGAGGGWPSTLADAARAVDHLATAGQFLADGRLQLDRVAAIGHSAGGQLAAWLAHRRSLRHGTAGSVTADTSWVPVVGAVSQAGVLDLVGADAENLGSGAVAELLGDHAGSVPQRYHHASPLAHVGDGARVVCVHGDADDVVPISQSVTYVGAALAERDPVQLVVLPGVGHMQVVDPEHSAWESCREELLRML